MPAWTWRSVCWRTASSARRAPLRDLDRLVPHALAIHTCARDAWLVPGPATALDEALARAGVVRSWGGGGPPATPPPAVATANARAEGPAALRALYAVAVGLDAAVEGEADVGRQVRAALVASPLADAAIFVHVLGRLLRQGRRRGWIREGHGVARLAARAAVAALGVDPPTGARPVGVVGAGAMGTRVASLLGPRAALYSRTPRVGVQPLSALAPAPVWVVATSARGPWFHPPGRYTALVDLGHPAQAAADPRRIDLDTLLRGADARLEPTARRAAEAAVDRATAELVERLRRAACRPDATLLDPSELGGVAGGHPPPQEPEDRDPTARRNPVCEPDSVRL